MGYFRKFNKVAYDVDGSGFKRALTNLTSSVKMADALIDQVSFFDSVTLVGGERLEQLSNRLYGTPDFYWTFLLANKELKNIWNDWAKSDYQLKEYCEMKYEGLAAVSYSGELSSKIFQPGDIVSIDSSYFRYAEVKSVHTNMGYIVIEPIWYCNKGEGDNRLECLASDPLASWIEPVIITDDLTQLTVVTENLNGEWVPDFDKTFTFRKVVKHMNAPHHYINTTTGEIVRADMDATEISIYAFEEWLNGINTQIKVIKPEYIHKVAEEFEREISK